MPSSNRRTEAAAAILAEQPSSANRAASDARRRVAAAERQGVKPSRNDAERVEALEAIKAGAIARQRDAAADLLALVADQIAAGITPTDGAYVLAHDADGEPIDARDVMAAATAPRTFRRVIGHDEDGAPLHELVTVVSRRATRPTDPFAVDPADARRLANAAATYAAWSVGRVSPDVWRNAADEALLALLAAAPSTPCSCTAELRRRYGSVLAWIDAVEAGKAHRADCPTCGGARRTPHMDRRAWSPRVIHQMTKVDRATWTTDPLANAAKRAAERSMEADRRAEPKSPEDLAAEADAAAEAEYLAERVTAAEVAEVLSLNAAEADALALDWGEARRADLARARGVKIDAAKKRAQRGRKTLAEKLAATAPAAVVRSILAADLPTLAERLDGRYVAAYGAVQDAGALARTMGEGHRNGARKAPAWPERFDGYGEDNAPVFRYTGTGAAKPGRIEVHGGAPALPAVFPAAIVAPWSSAEYAASYHRRAVRRAVERARLAPFRTAPQRHGSAREVCAFLRLVDTVPEAAPLMHRTLTYGPLPEPHPAPPTLADEARMEARRRALAAAERKAAAYLTRHAERLAREAAADAAWMRVWVDEDGTRTDADAARAAVLAAS